MKIGVLALAFVSLVAAEDGLDGWLRYAHIDADKNHLSSLPSNILALNNTKTSPVYSAGVELQKGFEGIFGKKLNVKYSGCDTSSAVVVATLQQYTKACGSIHTLKLKQDGFWLSVKDKTVHIIGENERGALYGAFEYLSLLGVGNFSKVEYASNPTLPVRWVNQWDNMDGSIERGYAGQSIFFEDDGIVKNLTRAGQYARLLASVGINGVVVNNVNANAELLTSDNIKGLSRIADVFRPYGVQLGISLNFAAPQSLGKLSTFDPLDDKVIAWWNDVTDQIYQHIPDFAGYLVKANSEGQPGPLKYNRTLADGANLFGNALEPHGGIVMFRAFVYDSLDWKDPKADRANAAVDYFHGLSNQFQDNIIVQIKYGPLDFQVHEPASPLFAHMAKTKTAIELPVTQEYLGQQCHMVYLPPLWKTTLDFDLRIDGKPSPVRDVLTGTAAVVNVGTDPTWLGHHLAMSNVHSYGRLAWDPKADVESMLREWICLTFSCESKVVSAISHITMNSWNAYLNYSGNLGLTTLIEIAYGSHYGPSPASMERNIWGFYTRADSKGVGMDRTVKTGTGFAGQYPDEVARRFEDIDTTPDDLLLWFHHVEYSHRLKSGKTVMQYFYDAHYDGSNAAHEFVSLWETLEKHVDSQRYEEVLFRQTYQAGHSITWRDAVTDYFYNLSRIPDEAKRFGHYPWRIEAESMELSGYKIVPVDIPNWASNHSAIETTSDKDAGTATTTLHFASGSYNIAVNYYDVSGGKAKYSVYVNDKEIGEFSGNTEDTLGHSTSSHLDGTAATRVTFQDIKIKKGDKFKIVGTPDGKENAPLDFVSFLPDNVVD
ncbi:hypothetical protein FE257_002037 [Aspergillus nanangensis]|uniref:Alpha-glucuronidase n=1 Tax=Aspergillus nanangensis TaxID=2582783 RepID=A0AAD4CT82_ASPNN|nr:hypothetical protein FE257_002037 [Aspergillus nanangensis]